MVNNMKKYFLTAALALFVSPCFAAVELDADANGLVDVSKGGLNALPTADNQLLQATGVGTFAWTSTLEGIIDDTKGGGDTTYIWSADRASKKQWDFVVKTPVDTDDFLLLKTRHAATITDIHCLAAGGGTISTDIQECDSAGANCATVDAAITADSDGAEDDGSLSNGAIDAGDWLKVVNSAPTGTVNFLTCSVYYAEE